MSSFYKMDPAAWDFGTTDLTLEQEAAYLRIVNATHKHMQPVPNNDRVLAGLFRCSTRKARALVEALVEAGKVRIENGQVVNDRAVSDLVQRGFVSSSRAESGAKGGRTKAESAAKALENKEADLAIASTREEKRREEKNKAAAEYAREEISPSLIAKLTHALGFDLQGIVPKYWASPDAAMIVSRWQTDLGLTHDEIVHVAAANMRMHGAPANGPKILTRHMQDFAAAKNAPPLTPATIPDPRPARPTGHGIKAQLPERHRK